MNEPFLAGRGGLRGSILFSLCLRAKGGEGMGGDEMSQKRRSETGREGVNVAGRVLPVRLCVLS
jgi:hypothetical protein